MLDHEVISSNGKKILASPLRKITMRLATFLIIGASLFAISEAQAQVTGVVTHTGATVEFKPGADGSDTGLEGVHGTFR